MKRENKGACPSQETGIEPTTATNSSKAALGKSSPESQPYPAPPSKEDKGNEELILDEKKVPISPELAKFLKEGNYATLTLMNEKGQVKIVDPEGLQIDLCGRVEGTTITGICDVEEFNLDPINEISIAAASRCQVPCWDGEIPDGKVVFHTRGPNKGKCPCHPYPGPPDPPHLSGERNTCPGVKPKYPMPAGCTSNSLFLRVASHFIQYEVASSISSGP